MHILEHAGRALRIKAATVGPMIMQELERAVDANVGGGDGRRAEIVLWRQERIVELREISVENGGGAFLFGGEAGPLELGRELRGQMVADEAEVVVLPHDPPRALESVALDDLLPEAESQVIG